MPVYFSTATGRCFPSQSRAVADMLFPSDCATLNPVSAASRPFSAMNRLSSPTAHKARREVVEPLEILSAVSRTAGVPLVPGNRIRVLKNAAENYPAWLDAIERAEHTIHFETYIVHGDDIGRKFVEVLGAKARQGVHVRVIYDWWGAMGASSSPLWRSLRKDGVEVRCFNPPRFESPLGWLSRDHRKTISVDSRVAFVSGLCVGQSWVGDPERGIEPWRDTGVEIAGPAVADVETAFAEMWSSLGPAIPSGDLPADEYGEAAGEVGLRVVASSPNTAVLYRLDQLIAAIARRSIWLTDAYFLATTPYIQALRAAADDGVDVRLLVPRASDIPPVASVSRLGYRPLLEAGVRIFEWNGPMLHSKTAVADGHWARVGSTNLNIASWLTNWELDVVVMDETFGQQMEAMYLEDLANSTEIVLNVKRSSPLPNTQRPRLRQRQKRGSAGHAMTGLLRVSNTVGAAITNRRPLGLAEIAAIVGSAGLLLFLALTAIVWPRAVSWPVGIFSAWLGISLLIKALRLYIKRQR
jgi:cardiolipin synthase